MCGLIFLHVVGRSGGGCASEEGKDGEYSSSHRAALFKYMLLQTVMLKILEASLIILQHGTYVFVYLSISVLGNFLGENC